MVIAGSSLAPLQGFPENDDGYERCRDQRIRENLERMRKLGIADLALEIKSQHLLHSTPRRKPSARKRSNSTPRRSSRLHSSTPVSYVEADFPKREKKRKLRGRTVEMVCQDELYTEEHEKLLGSYETAWTLFVDGRGPDGRLIYDQINGKTCHQCRQKTLGRRTQCSRCETLQGQFCGDCLFMRYGENVLEANKNPDWICPVCRGICNCSLCRLKKGWPPTGLLYRTSSRLGYKSVAHYLIQTRRLSTNMEKPQSADHISAKKSLPFNDTEDNLQSKNMEHEDRSGTGKSPGEKSNIKESRTIVAMTATTEFITQSVANRIDIQNNMNSYDIGSGCCADKCVENKQKEVDDTYFVIESSPDGGTGGKSSNECDEEKHMLMSGKKKRKKNNSSSPSVQSQDCIAQRLRSKGSMKNQASDDIKRKVEDVSLTPNSDCIAQRLRSKGTKKKTNVQ